MKDPREVVALALARHSQPTARTEHIARLASMSHRLDLAEFIVGALVDAGCLSADDSTRDARGDQ